jgi:CYTH domain-containing protein
MTELERELTYLVGELPADLDKFPSKIVEDNYIPFDAVHPLIRIRRSGNRYFITKKYPVDTTDGSDGDSSRQLEHTIDLTRAEYDFLNQLEGKRVKKRRFSYKVNGHDAEIDVCLGDLAGLVLIDFEFDSDEAMEKFVKPDFAKQDMSQERLVAGGVLAGKKFSDIADELLKKYDYTPVENVKKYEEEA